MNLVVADTNLKDAMKSTLTRTQLSVVIEVARKTWGSEGLLIEWSKRTTMSKETVRNFLKGSPVKATTLDKLLRPLGLHVAVVICQQGEVARCCQPEEGQIA